MPEAATVRPTVADTRRRLAQQDWLASDEMLGTLFRDERSGVRALAARVVARRAALEAERDRMARMLRWERQCWARGENVVAGVDEAGRGPLAGPVVAAAVILSPGWDVAGVDDSKRLTPARREALFPSILKRADAVGVGVVWQDVIDRENIRWATFRAMRQALRRLRREPDVILVDGERIPGLRRRQTGLAGGDRRSLSIAAASVVAKVVRDRIMGVLDRQYPGYGFWKHKGYGTLAHRDAIARLGPCPLHRRTFLTG